MIGLRRLIHCKCIYFCRNEIRGAVSKVELEKKNKYSNRYGIQFFEAIAGTA